MCCANKSAANLNLKKFDCFALHKKIVFVNSNLNSNKTVRVH